jgi:hypothetical protein
LFSEVFEKLQNHEEVMVMTGHNMKAFGRDVGRNTEGRRNHLDSYGYTAEDGSKRLRIRMNIKGEKGKVIVWAEVRRGKQWLSLYCVVCVCERCIVCTVCALYCAACVWEVSQLSVAYYTLSPKSSVPRFTYLFSIPHLRTQVSDRMAANEYVYIICQNAKTGKVVTIEDNRDRLEMELQNNSGDVSGNLINKFFMGKKE